MHRLIAFENGIRCASGTVPNHLEQKQGVFESILAYCADIYDGRVWMRDLDCHLTRLADGSTVRDLPSLDPALVRACVRMALKEHNWKTNSKALLRIVNLPLAWFLTLQPWQNSWEPQLEQQGGIRLLSVYASRAAAETKNCAAQISVAARLQATAAGAHEALLVDSAGVVREGAWSNFFWVNSAGVICSAANKVLRGVTRSRVLSFANSDIQFELGDFCHSDVLLSSREAFLTQATTGVVPVISLDGQPLSSACPGTITLSIMDLFARLRYSERNRIM